MVARKLKVSITLSESLVRRIDRRAAKGETRSGVIERWLLRASRLEVEREIEEATADYYEGLNAGETAEEESLARSLSRAARKLVIDEPGAGGRPAPRRRGSRR